jgi:hypothetical protein
MSHDKRLLIHGGNFIGELERSGNPRSEFHPLVN